MLKLISVVVIISIIYLEFGDCGSSSKVYCVKCSSKDIKCAQKPSKSSDKKCKTKGKDPPNCYVFNDANGAVERGCDYDLKQDCEVGINCQFCSTDYCNLQIFPTNRLQCYHCEGKNCENITANQTLPCATFKTGEDECYTYIDNDKFIRGCKSDNIDLCKNNPQNCHICRGNNCNHDTNPTPTPSPPHCPVSTTATVPVPSPPPVTGSQQSCFRCRSDIDPLCAHYALNTQTELKPSNCRTNTQNKGETGCYIEKYLSHVYRGCLIDLDDLVRDKCKDIGYEHCRACYSNNCNDGIAPQGSSAEKINGITFGLLITIVSFINTIASK